MLCHLCSIVMSRLFSENDSIENLFSKNDSIKNLCQNYFANNV